MDHDPPVSSVHGILQARILEWVAMPSSRDLPNSGIEPVSPVALTLQVDPLLLSHWEIPRTIKAQANLTPTFLPWSSLVAQRLKASACNAGDLGSIPGSGISPGEGNGNPFQYSCLENPMDGGAWWATVHRSQRVRHD